MHKAQTLVVLIPAFPANEQEKNWLPTQQLFLVWVKKMFPGIQIIVLSLIYPDRISEYEWEGLKVLSFDGMRYRKLKQPLLWRRIWKQLSKINNTQAITGILSFWCGECALIGRYFSRLHSIAHRIVICGQDAREKNKLVRFIRPAANELIAISDFLADEFYRNHHIMPAHIIPNGIDTSLFSTDRSTRDIDVIGVGSLSRLKQYDLFIEIIAGLKKEMPDIRAVLCGDGEDVDRIKKMREDYFLENIVDMPGLLVPSKAIRMMQRAKIFLHPSSYEGFSMACLEALYAGAHVISFTKPMHHDIQNWHIVKTKEEMQQKALELLKDPDIVYEPVMLYSMNDTVKKIMGLFEFSETQKDI
jgi:glycosyltransferase involved in cell wall biosynthesis